MQLYSVRYGNNGEHCIPILARNKASARKKAEKHLSPIGQSITNII